jgi:hypothetical protein
MMISSCSPLDSFICLSCCCVILPLSNLGNRQSKSLAWCLCSTTLVLCVGSVAAIRCRSTDYPREIGYLRDHPNRETCIRSWYGLDVYVTHCYVVYDLLYEALSLELVGEIFLALLPLGSSVYCLIEVGVVYSVFHCHVKV